MNWTKTQWGQCVEEIQSNHESKVNENQDEIFSIKSADNPCLCVLKILSMHWFCCHICCYPKCTVASWRHLLTLSLGGNFRANVRGVCTTLLWFTSRWWFKCSWGTNFTQLPKMKTTEIVSSCRQKAFLLPSIIFFSWSVKCFSWKRAPDGAFWIPCRSEDQMPFTYSPLSALFFHFCMQDLTELLRFGSSL